MTLTLETWHVISLLLTIGGMLIGAGKAFFNRFEKSMKERDKTLEAVVRRLESGQAQHSQEIHRLEKDMLNIKVELSEKYVNKMDFNRTFTVVDAKLDRLYELINNK